MAEQAVLPSNTFDRPWIVELPQIKQIPTDSGKWMLFVPKNQMDEEWISAVKAFREGKLVGVFQMKCSTMFENDRAQKNGNGVIIFHCSHSYDEESIMIVGKNLLDVTKHANSRTIYYKTDAQTLAGTQATGQKKNYIYKLDNPFYQKC